MTFSEDMDNKWLICALLLISRETRSNLSGGVHCIGISKLFNCVNLCFPIKKNWIRWSKNLKLIEFIWLKEGHI